MPGLYSTKGKTVHRQTNPVHLYDELGHQLGARLAEWERILAADSASGGTTETRRGRLLENINNQALAYGSVRNHVAMWHISPWTGLLDSLSSPSFIVTGNGKIWAFYWDFVCPNEILVSDRWRDTDRTDPNKKLTQIFSSAVLTCFLSQPKEFCHQTVSSADVVWCQPK